MVNIEFFIKSLKITWIRRMINQNKSSKWINLCVDTQKINFECLLKFGDNYLGKSIKTMSNLFWIDVLKHLEEFQNILKKYDDVNELLRVPLWQNSEIKINKECVHYKSWADKGVIIIADLLDENGNFLNFETFCLKYSIKCAFTHFYGLKQVILKKWPELLDLENNIVRPHRPKFIEIICKHKKGSKSINDIFISNIYKKPKHEYKWETKVQIENSDQWKIINENIFKTTNDSRLIWFQYRVVHRIIATNKFLHFISINNNSLCTFCKHDQETIEHLFFECNLVNELIKEFQRWLKDKANFEINLTVSDVILLVKDKNMKALNLMLILLKLYIYRTRLKNQTLHMVELIHVIKSHYNIEKIIYKSKGLILKFEVKWKKYHNLFL